jgi:hypothetical protein
MQSLAPTTSHTCTHTPHSPPYTPLPYTCIHPYNQTYAQTHPTPPTSHAHVNHLTPVPHLHTPPVSIPFPPIHAHTPTHNTPPHSPHLAHLIGTHTRTTKNNTLLLHAPPTSTHHHQASPSMHPLTTHSHVFLFHRYRLHLIHSLSQHIPSMYTHPHRSYMATHLIRTAHTDVLAPTVQQYTCSPTPSTSAPTHPGQIHSTHPYKGKDPCNTYTLIHNLFKHTHCVTTGPSPHTLFSQPTHPLPPSSR